MKQSLGYILVVGQPLSNITITNSAIDPYAPVVTIASPEQAIAKAQENQPHLVILSGDTGQTWSPQVARQIRQNGQGQGTVIVALTASSELSWADSAASEIDGFCVEPLSADVLTTLNESAIAKQKCFQALQG